MIYSILAIITIFIAIFIIFFYIPIKDRKAKEKEKEEIERKEAKKQRKEEIKESVRIEYTRYRYICCHCGSAANDLREFYICPVCRKERRVIYSYGLYGNNRYHNPKYYLKESK